MIACKAPLNPFTIELEDDTICYGFGSSTCIRVCETNENGKIRLEPLAGNQMIDGKWVAVDNTTGDAWTAEFSRKRQAIRWLRGKFEI